MRKYVITLIHKATLGGFPMAFGNPISYQELELEGYLTKKDFDELVEAYEKANKLVLAITDVTGEK